MATFCNKALFVRNLKRFWPLAAVCLLIGFFTFIVPAAQMQRHSWRHSNFIPNIMDNLALYSGVFVPILSIITAIAVFGYLHKLRAASFVSALPITRRCLYITNWLSGLALMLGPALLIGLIYGTLIVGRPVPSEHFLLWLGFMVISHLLFFSMAVIVTFLTGNRIMQVFLYGLLNFIIYALYGIIWSVLDNLVFGLAFTAQTFPLAVQLLTPMYAVGDTISRVTPTLSLFENQNVALTWGIYLVAAALLAVLGYFMYRARNIESAGDMIAHKPVRSVFVYLIGFLFGTLFSFILLGMWNWGSHLSTREITIRLAISMAFFGSLGCLFSQMIIQKQLRVIKTAWKGIVVFVLVIISMAAFIALDASGFERRIPNPDNVAAVSVRGMGRWRQDGQIQAELGAYSQLLLEGTSLLSQEQIQDFRQRGQPIITQAVLEEIKQRTPHFFESREAIEAAVRLHEAILGDRGILDGGNYTAMDFIWVTITYKMNDGQILSREYGLPTSRVPMIDSVAALNELHNQPEAVGKRNRFLSLPENALQAAVVSRRLTHDFLFRQTLYDSEAILIPDEARPQLMDALRADAAAGNLGYLRQAEIDRGTQIPKNGTETLTLFLVYDKAAAGVPRVFEPRSIAIGEGFRNFSGLILQITIREDSINTQRFLSELS